MLFKRAAAAAVIVFLNPLPVFSQDVVFTVSTASADVYKAPSTGSPVIGRAPRGAALPVTRELGSWVRVTWPEAPDGVGYVHVSTGRLVNGAPAETVRAAAGEAVRLQAATARMEGGATSPGPRPVYVTPVPHVVGIGGGLMSGSPLGLGATARMWRRDRVGVRFDVSRYFMATVAPGRATSTHLEPSVLVALTDYVANYVWLRPYVGGGVSFRHQTFGPLLAEPGGSLSDNSVGFQAFGGSEVTVANAPQLAVSGDFGYRSRRSAFGAFDVGGFGASISAHWYLK